MESSAADHPRTMSPETEATELRNRLLATRKQSTSNDSSRSNRRTRSASGSRSPRGRNQRRSVSRSRSRSRSHGRSSSVDVRRDPQSGGIASREAERRGDERGRSRSQDNSDRNGGRHWSPSPGRRPDTRRNRSRSPVQESRGRSDTYGRDSTRDRDRNSYRDDRYRGRGARDSRSRSKSPTYRANDRNQPNRQERNPSPYNKGDRYGRRQSPTYDSYQPVRHEQNHSSNGNRHENGTDSSRDRYDRGGGNSRDEYRGRRYEADHRRDDVRDGERRDDRPYRGGRRPQEMMPEFSDNRREQRLAIKFSIWAPSPTEEELQNRSPSPDREVKKKPASKAQRKKHDSDSGSDSEDTDAGRKRRRKSSKSSKHKRSSRSHHTSSSRKRDKRSSKRRDRSPTPLSVSESEDQVPSRGSNRRHRSRGDSQRRESEMEIAQSSSSAAAHAGSSEAVEEYPDDMWVEKKIEMPDDDQEVGPVPLYLNDGKMNERSYGGALLAGEGSAMAAYIQDGKRIPRRGEIGLESDQIEHYEQAGFVMSGSRHQRMNAVRVRKENQVISAEEKRALMIFNQEEKIKKDNKIINEMREMVASKLRSTGHSV